MHDRSRLIVSFNSDKLEGRDRYTRDFKYPHSQKAAGLRSGDRVGHGDLQRLLMILSSQNVYIKNSLTGLAVGHVATSCIYVTNLFQGKHGTTFSLRSVK
ncbi:hypothetical protein NPIL_37611 [Nephila pilipes]|uniref:Uncharacterized protein n=1 Tax=Nephila pilipes TaxID=299642 RepID=A0A8X6TM17_NEPPI|nr:hypothetical protein NPIL_37611 [Nephila pilipes]